VFEAFKEGEKIMVSCRSETTEERRMRYICEFETANARNKLLNKVNPLIIHLKYKYYDMIKSGVKTVEYRECKPYWTSRLKNKTEIVFCPGYNLDNSLDIKADILGVDTVRWQDLPSYARDEFRLSEYIYFYAISFKVKELKN
jgi:hypothetical protein